MTCNATPDMVRVNLQTLQRGYTHIDASLTILAVGCTLTLHQAARRSPNLAVMYVGGVGNTRASASLEMPTGDAQMCYTCMRRSVPVRTSRVFTPPAAPKAMSVSSLQKYSEYAGWS